MCLADRNEREMSSAILRSCLKGRRKKRWQGERKDESACWKRKGLEAEESTVRICGVFVRPPRSIGLPPRAIERAATATLVVFLDTI